MIAQTAARRNPAANLTGCNVSKVGSLNRGDQSLESMDLMVNRIIQIGKLAIF